MNKVYSNHTLVKSSIELFLVGYERGRGVPKDLAAAIEWYKKAAAQGHPDAIGNLERLGCR